VSPTQAAVYLTFIRPHPVHSAVNQLCHETLPTPTDTSG
jgi:hypothetical protein